MTFQTQLPELRDFLEQARRATRVVLGDDLFPAGTLLVTPVRVPVSSPTCTQLFFFLSRFSCVKLLSSPPAIQREKEGRRAGA